MQGGRKEGRDWDQQVVESLLSESLHTFPCLCPGLLSWTGAHTHTKVAFLKTCLCRPHHTPNPRAGTHSTKSRQTRWLPFLPCSLSFLLAPFLFVFPLPSWALGHHRTGLSLDGVQPLACMAEALPWLMTLWLMALLLGGHGWFHQPTWDTVHWRPPLHFTSTVVLSCAFSLLSTFSSFLSVLPCPEGRVGRVSESINAANTFTFPVGVRGIPSQPSFNCHQRLLPHPSHVCPSPPTFNLQFLESSLALLSPACTPRAL